MLGHRLFIAISGGGGGGRYYGVGGVGGWGGHGGSLLPTRHAFNILILYFFLALASAFDCLKVGTQVSPKPPLEL